MTKPNINYYIPKTEEVRYLEENLTPEQQRINESYENEWRDRVEYGPQYGPGNDQSKSQAAKFVGKAAVVTTVSLLFPPAGVAIGGAATWVVGKAGEAICEEDRNKEVWRWIADIGNSSVLAGGADFAALKSGNTTLKELKSLCDSLEKEKDKAMLQFHINHMISGKNHHPACEVCQA